MQEGISEGAAPGVLEHALGLLEIRTGHIERALDYLKRAADSETEGTRHRYVYAVALHDTGKPAEALALLERLNVERPGNPELLYALVGFARELGDAAKAGRYQAQLQGVAQAAGLR